MSVRLGRESDINSIKRLVDRNRHHLGFTMRSYLGSSIAASELNIFKFKDSRKIFGFVRWHKRRDGWVTLYQICVATEYRGCGIGGELLDSLPKGPIRLKCHHDNRSATNFYRKHRFKVKGSSKTPAGKKLNIWERGV